MNNDQILSALFDGETIPNEWLKDGAIVPITHETVALLIKTLKNVPTWTTVSQFDEYSVHVRFNVSVPFAYKNEERLIGLLHGGINASLCDLFRKHNGTYTNPRIDLNKRTTSC